ncbi:hypothetical protein ACFLZ7_01480 [Nanoarchaeota archaeon]
MRRKWPRKRIKKELIGSGYFSNVYRLTDGTCVKVYCYGRLSPERIKRTFDNSVEIAEQGINIPQPIEMDEVKVSEDEYGFNLATLTNRIRGKLAKGTKKHPAIRMEYVPGKDLRGKVIPSRQTSDKICTLNKKIVGAGWVHTDAYLKNYRERNDGEMFLMDCDEFERIGDQIAEPIREYKARRFLENPRIPTSELIEALLKPVRFTPYRVS